MKLDSDTKINISLPKVHTRLSSILQAEQFIPVIQKRRYNIIKIKDLCQLREKDRRLGRTRTESSSLQHLLRAQKNQNEKRSTYQVTRQLRGREMHNQSYLNIMEKIKYDRRYWSIDKSS